MPVKIKKSKGPKEGQEEVVVKKTPSTGETINKYSEAKYVADEDKLKSNGGQPAAQKRRKKGSTTLTAAGTPVKKYNKGTSGVKMRKKDC